MPAKSVAQLLFMHAVARGDITAPGLSKKEAQEFIDATDNPGKLPKKVKQHRSRGSEDNDSGK